jgi:hypothetical protein
VTYSTRTGAYSETATASKKREIPNTSNERDYEHNRNYRLHYTPNTVSETTIVTVFAIVVVIADTGIRGRVLTSSYGLASTYTTENHTNKTRTRRRRGHDAHRRLGR